MGLGKGKGTKYIIDEKGTNSITALCYVLCTMFRI